MCDVYVVVYGGCDFGEVLVEVVVFCDGDDGMFGKVWIVCVCCCLGIYWCGVVEIDWVEVVWY